MSRNLIAKFAVVFSLTGTLTIVLSCNRPSGRGVTAPASQKLSEKENDALRREILAMAEEDQRLRFALMEHPPSDMKLLYQLEKVDRTNTTRMKEIVARYGWPSRSLVGAEVSHSAWLLVQHAAHDREFQRQCLRMMEPLVEIGEIDAQNYAYLLDRVRVLDGKPQLYGTQFRTKDGVTQPFPIENPDRLDERRKAVGLGPFEEYEKRMRELEGK